MNDKKAEKDLSPIHLQMLNAEPDEFKIQETSRAGVTRISRRYATCLDKYHGAFKRDSAKGVDTDQHGAGLRFMRTYHLATKALSCKLASLNSGGGGGSGMQDAVLDASHEIKKAIRAIEAGAGGSVGAKIVERICGWNETTADCEKLYNWPSGHAIIRLREGLNDLVAFYSGAPPASASARADIRGGPLPPTASPQKKTKGAVRRSEAPPPERT